MNNLKTNKIMTAVEFYAEQMQLKEQFTQEEFNNITNQAKEMEKQQSGLQEIKTELDNLNAKLFNLSNELYIQTSNLCGEFDRPINKKLHEEVGHFYIDIFKGQIGFQMSIIDEIVNTLNHLKSATNK